MADATVGHGKLGFSRRFAWAGLALGFGLGGFFDGILLHQVLQWHHLLSGVDEARQDIRLLILTDGLFHVLMYVITGLGLWLLWSTRGEFPGAGADRRLLANALIGFGAWHILDSILSHWLLGIHRVRMDTDNPLLWDLAWFGVFGLVPLAIGWVLHRRAAANGRRLMSSPIALVLAVMVAGPIAALPPPDQTQVVVLFRPGISEQQAFAAIMAAQARVLGADPSGQVWAVDLGSDGNRSELYRHGAMVVSNSILPLGCFQWTRV